MNANAIEEYKDITTHIRERHATIWNVRNIYTLIMLAIVGFTYQLQFTGWPLRIVVSVFAFGACAMTSVVCIIEYRYAKMEALLMRRAIELEKELSFSQYTILDHLKGAHPRTFKRHARVIYSLLFTAYLLAIVVRMFL